MKYAFILEQQKTYLVTLLCRLFKVSTSAYDAWKASCDVQTLKMQQERLLEDQGKLMFVRYKEVYGSRRLSDALRKAGLAVGRH